MVPMALTALSGIRFGGLAMRFDDANIQFDHDLDFVLHFSEAANSTRRTYEAVGLVLQEFAEHLTNITGLKARACYLGAPETIALKPGQTSNGAWNFFVYVDLPGHET